MNIYTPPEGANHRVVNMAGEFLVAPIDAWGYYTPEWTHIPEAGALFTKAKAEEQRTFLTWAPHKLIGVKIKKRK